MAHTQVIPESSHSPGLAEVLERVLDKGVVIAGDIRIKLCDVELLTIQIRLLIASVDKARELGVSWWWQASPAHERVPPPKEAISRQRSAINEQPSAISDQLSALSHRAPATVHYEAEC
jgi:hypothetical protein